MELRKSYLQRSMHRARLQRRAAVVAMLAVAGCAAFLLQQWAQRPGQEAVAAAAPAVPAPAPAPAASRVAGEAIPAAARRVYPYSIVPGGVTDRIELARAIMADRVVAAHYAGFAVDKASLHTLAKARAVYVSYRKGDQVYWTTRKVTLAEGESVLSDGLNEIRARCGNRISDTPRLPVEAGGFDERELDTPVGQALAGGEGALRTVAFDFDDQDGGQGFVLAPIPNGAGLLSAAPSQASFSQIGLDSLFDRLFDSNRRLTALAVLQDPASNMVRYATASEAATGSGSGSSIDSTSATATGVSGSTTSDSGDKPADGDTGKPPPAPPSLRPAALPGDPSPPQSHDLPEPGTLWLGGVAAAALLLQRRLRARRPR